MISLSSRYRPPNISAPRCRSPARSLTRSRQARGRLSLSTWTSTSISAPFIPSGTLIEQATVSAPSLGGQTAVVGSFYPFGDFEGAGTYFVEVSGTSGLGTLRLAVDGNVTTLAVPEPSTWAMFGIGFAGLAAVGLKRRRGDRESARYAL